MAKDPAVLLYNDKWSASTAGMKSEYRAWYMDLIIYQFGNGSIPDDEDTLAGICHVLPSEYAKFITFCEQIIPQKFERTDDGYVNSVAGEIIKKRENFIDKRMRSGIIGSMIKKLKNDAEVTENQIDEIITYLNSCTTEELLELKSEANVKQVLKQVLKQMLKQVDKQVLKHCINEDVIENEDVIVNYTSEKGGVGGKTKRFVRPTIQDVQDVFIDIGSTAENGAKFFYHYESTGWIRGRTAIRDWKAAARNWVSSDYSQPNGQQPPPPRTKTAAMFDEMDRILQQLNAEAQNGSGIKELA